MSSYQNPRVIKFLKILSVLKSISTILSPGWKRLDERTIEDVQVRKMDPDKTCGFSVRRENKAHQKRIVH